jgi:hypothetical protein
MTGLWHVFVVACAAGGFVGACWLVCTVNRPRRTVRISAPYRLSPDQRKDILIQHAINGQRRRVRADFQKGNFQ